MKPEKLILALSGAHIAAHVRDMLHSPSAWGMAVDPSTASRDVNMIFCIPLTADRYKMGTP